MEVKIILRKGTVIEEIGKGCPEYLVKDLFSEEEVVVTLSVKLYMNYFRLKIGWNIYFISPSNRMNRGRYVNATDFKEALFSGRSDLLIQKSALDKKIKEEQS